MDNTADSDVVTLYSVEEYAEIHDLTLDDIEEMFYNETIEELADEFGIALLPKDDEEDDEDNE